jgi:DHA2 family multidrug resistance protein
VSDLSASANSSAEGQAPVVAAVKPPPRPAAADLSAAPLAGWAMWGAGILLSLANFMAALDTTIANVSVPNIAGGLGVSANEGTWVITSYSVAEAITVPLTGWLAGRFGAVRVFVGAMVMFTIFSALCGLSPTLNVLIVFRVLQGLAGGPMIPLSQTLLLRVFPKEKANQAMGLWATTTVIAPIAGPILGGVLCDTYSWPWVFYINVPVGIVTAFLSWRVLKARETPTRKLPVDRTGLAIMVVWIAALQIVLDKGEELDWFQSRTIIILSLIAAIGFAAFLIWELTDANPIVNLKVFRSKSYSISLAVMCLCFGAYFAAVVILPLWMQTNLNFTATWAGLAVAPSGVFAVVMSPIVARLMGRFDHRLLIFIGVIGLAGTFYWRSGFASNIDFAHIIAPQFLQGAFVTMFFVPIFSLALGSLSQAELAGGAGLLSFTRTMAGAFATSMAETYWSNSGRDYRVALLNQFNSAKSLDMLHSGLSHARTLAQFENIVQTQSVMLATDKFFMTVATLMVVAGFSIWFTARPRSGVKPPAGAH